MVAPGLFQRLPKGRCIDNAERGACHIAAHCEQTRQIGRYRQNRCSGHRSFSPAIKNLLGDDTGKSSSHERPALAWTEKLVRGNREQELEQVAVEIRIPFLVQWFGCDS